MQTGFHLRDDIQVLIGVRNAINAERRYLSCRLLMSEESDALTQISGHGGSDLGPLVSTLNRYDANVLTNTNVILPAGHTVVTRCSSFHTPTLTSQVAQTSTSPVPVSRNRSNGVIPYVASNINNEGLNNPYPSYPPGMISGLSQLKPYATYAGTVSLLSKRSLAIGLLLVHLKVNA